MLLSESAKVSKAMQNLFSPYKLNVAALGNVVRQLHVHHVARFENDVAWPKPVWGNQSSVAYEESDAAEIISKLKLKLTS